MPRSHPSAHRRLAAASVLALLALPALAAEEGSDARAVELAEATLESMGGRDAWEATRFFRFDFFGFRLHHWDRYTGRHRLEGESREGVRYLVLHDVDTREGRVWLDGEEVADAATRDEWLGRAYEAWINDTYWLLMPYKLLDPGVTLTYDGEETTDGVVYDVLQLSFDAVGLTPGDRYWAYLERESGLMHRWAYHLQDWEADREATSWWWTDWGRHGRILLSPTRVNAADDSVRTLGDLAVFDQLPDSVFESPDPVTTE